MRIFLKTAIAALSISCAAVMIAPPAQSATLLDFLRGTKSKKTDNAIPLDTDLGADPVDQTAKPLPRVAAPKYFTYKADKPRLINVAAFAPSMDLASNNTEPSTGSVQAVAAPATIDFATSPRAYMVDVKAKADANVATTIETYYKAHEGLLWVDANGVTEKAHAALAKLAQAADVGLDPADYAVVDPSDTFDAVDAVTRQRQLMQFEIELSAATLSYIQDTKRGRIDPNRISEYHDFKRKTINLTGAMINLQATPDVAAYLESRNPSDPDFLALRKELANLRGETGEQEQPIVINLTGLLKPGQSNPELANIVKAIEKRGSDKLKVDHSVTLASYDGSETYSDDLVALVKDFQTENGLKPDGIIGRGSVRILMGGDTSGDKVDKVIVAMEQRRWLPEDLGARHVFINQPAFMAYYFENGHQQFDMKVVVGSPGHQTFFFQDEIETVEFNPYWGVPRSIIVNEMLPKLREDPSYLDRLGYEVSVGGRAVSSSEIDWYTTDSVDVRQPPGGDNALGKLKILFPNAHSIYMHDTPAKSFFKRDMRALSHGCVRLSDPRKMAAAVMGTTVDEIDAQINMGNNHSVQVPQKFPVYVSYFTAWPTPDGVVEYFDDVYSRDTYMRKALDITKAARHADS